MLASYVGRFLGVSGIVDVQAVNRAVSAHEQSDALDTDEPVLSTHNYAAINSIVVHLVPVR